MTAEPFPFDMFGLAHLEGEIAAWLEDVRGLCLHPPFPWGQWLYARQLQARLPNLPGAFAECGVAKGGMSLFLGHLALAHGRRVYALDSFEGLPPPDPAQDNAYFRQGDYGARAERGDLLARFSAEIEARGLTDVVVPVKGFFEHSLGTLPPDLDLAFLHIDVDLYGSALECLQALWPRVVPGGLVVMDDFFHQAQGPARATADFFRQQRVSPLLHVSFPYSVVVVKGEAAPLGAHRALDGNRYSFDWLREDPALRRALDEAVARAEGGPERRRANALALQRLLDPKTQDRSASVYEYWRALEDYWDDMDVDRADDSPPMQI